MACAANIAERVIGVVRGEVPPMDVIREMGIIWHETPTGLQVTHHPAGLPEVAVSVGDFAKGLVALSGDPDRLRQWANFVLCTDVVDVAAIESGTPGEFMLDAIWDASFATEIAPEILLRARDAVHR